MGYETEFSGRFHTDHAMDRELADYLNAFNETRHMKRSVSKIKKEDPEWKNHCFKGNLGREGSFYIPERKEDLLSLRTPDVIDYNCPPSGQPGLWCQWMVPDDDLSAIEWDGGEKFYEYTEWLQYIIDNFIKPEGYIVSGEVYFLGEENGDSGLIVCEDNKVRIVNEYEINPEFQRLFYHVSEN